MLLNCPRSHLQLCNFGIPECRKKQQVCQISIKLFDHLIVKHFCQTNPRNMTDRLFSLIHPASLTQLKVRYIQLWKSNMAGKPTILDHVIWCISLVERTWKNTCLVEFHVTCTWFFSANPLLWLPFLKKINLFQVPPIASLGKRKPVGFLSTSIWRSQELLDDLDTAQGFFHQAIRPKMRQALPNNERQGAGFFFQKNTPERAMFEQFFVTWKERLPWVKLICSSWKWRDGLEDDPFQNGFLAGAMLCFRECRYFPSINLFGGYYVMFTLGRVHQEGWGNWSIPMIWVDESGSRQIHFCLNFYWGDLIAVVMKRWRRMMMRTRRRRMRMSMIIVMMVMLTWESQRTLATPVVYLWLRKDLR